MNKSEFVETMSRKVKLIRNEMGYTQDKMAEILSISKKTLVEVEKGRSSLGFCVAVAVAIIFEESENVQMIFGGDAKESVKSLATHHNESYNSTMGGKIWWKDMKEANGYKIQQNVISAHYRILNKSNKRVCSSFEEEYIGRRFKELSENG